MAFESEQGNRGITQGREGLRGMSLTDSAGIFLQRHVADVMGAVFDAPMAAPPGQQFPRASDRSWNAGDRVLDLRRPFPVAARGTDQTADLLEAGPIEMAGQSRAGFQATVFQSAMSLVRGFRNLKMLFVFGSIDRGKNPPETRRRWLPSRWVDCL